MASETPLRISGLTRFSSVDYPGCVAAVIYLDRRAIPAERLAWREVAEWLDSRHGLLEAVVFDGWNPLALRGLAAAMQETRAMGFRVGLRVRRVAPLRLDALLPLVDWISLGLRETRRERAH
jgi:pyruvate formate lyase activating enzyme